MGAAGSIGDRHLRRKQRNISIDNRATASLGLLLRAWRGMPANNDACGDKHGALATPEQAASIAAQRSGSASSAARAASSSPHHITGR